MLTVMLSHDEADFERLRPEWESLQAISDADSIYLTWDWITLWWHVFGAGRELWLLEARDESDQLAGLGLMMRSTYYPLRGLSWQQVEFVGAPSPCEHLDFLARPGDEEAVARAFMERLMAERSRCDVLSFTRLPEQSRTLALLRAWPDIDWDEDALVAPAVHLPGDWDTFFKSLSYNKRYAQRRLRRAIDANFPDGRWQWRRVTQPEELGPTLDAVIAAHQEQWMVRGKPGAFAGSYETLFRQAAQRFMAKDWLELSRVDVDGQLAGGFLGYSYRNRFYHFAQGINQDYTDLQIGHILVEQTLHHLIQEGEREYDFLWGEEPYKYSWGAEDRRDITLTWRFSRRARLICASESALRAGWSRVKRALPDSLRDRAKAAIKR